MGLDMYLEERKYIGKAEVKLLSNEYGWHNNDGQEFKNVKELVIEAGYWRKANAIHKWFVDNVQDGNDDCGEYEVSIEKLQELLEICKELKSKMVLSEDTNKNGDKYIVNYTLCKKLLPTQDGFFFGSTSYDEWYYEDIENTIKIIENLDGKGEYYYTSSW